MINKPLIELFKLPIKSITLHHLTLHNEIYQVVFSSPQDKHWFFQSIDRQPNCLILDTTNPLTTNIYINEYQDLIDYLNNLLTTTSDFKGNIDCLIINDISRFYWSLRMENNLSKLSTLSSIITTITEKYKCNVIICSWDYKFDRGVKNFKQLNFQDLDINHISYVKNYLTLNILYIYNCKIFKYENRWIEI